MKANLAAMIMVATMGATMTDAKPSVQDYMRLKTFRGDWNQLRYEFETMPKIKAHDVHLYQESRDYCHADSNLNDIYMYNLNVEGCVFGPLYIYSNSAQRTGSSFILPEIMRWAPCFRNGDDVVFGANMAVNDGNIGENRVLFPQIVTIAAEANSVGLMEAHLLFNHNIAMDSIPLNDFFWQLSASEARSIPHPVGYCGLPTSGPFEQTTTSVSGFRFAESQVIQVGVQLYLEPTETGCAFAGPINVFQGIHSTTDFKAVFPGCVGYVYARAIDRNALAVPVDVNCPRVLPYKIPYDSRSPYSFWFQDPGYAIDTVDCAGELAPPSTPVIASSLYVKRSTPGDLQNTDIDYIMFYANGKPTCTYKWTATIDDRRDDHFIHADQFLKQKPCFLGTVVQMKIHYKNICSGVETSVPVSLMFSPDGKTSHKLVVDFTSTNTRKSLNPVITDVNLCVSKPAEDTTLPIRDVNRFLLKRETEAILNTKITTIEIYKDEQCKGTWKLDNVEGKSTNVLSVERLLKSTPCLALGDVVQLRYRFADICVDSDVYIQQKARLSGPGSDTMVVHLPGNTPDTFLDEYVEIVPNTCAPEFVMQPLFRKENAPVVSIAAFYIEQTEDMYLEGIEIDNIEFIAEDNPSCVYKWTGPFPHASTRRFLKIEMRKWSSCLTKEAATNTLVRINYDSKGICANMPTLLPMKISFDSESIENGLHVTVDGKNSNRAFSVTPTLYDRCVAPPPTPDQWPKYSAGKFTFNNLKGFASESWESLVMSIKFYRDEKCSGVWDVPSGTQTVTYGDLLEKIVKTCIMGPDSIVYLQYQYRNYCPNRWYWLPVVVTLKTGPSHLTITTNTSFTEDHLNPTFDINTLRLR